jgi:hypothetical protein
MKLIVDYKYSLPIKYSFILGRLNADNFGCLGKKKHSKCKQITFHRGYLMYHRFLQTAWLVPKESNINKYLTTRQYDNELLANLPFSRNFSSVMYGSSVKLCMLSPKMEGSGLAWAAHRPEPTKPNK